MHDDNLFGKLRAELAIFNGGFFARVDKLISEAISNGLEFKLDVETVVSTALAAFDRYIVPYDIPKVPEFLEKRLESGAKQLLEYLIREAFDLFTNDDDKVAA